MEERCFVCEYSSSALDDDDDDDAENVVPCQFSFVACLREEVPVYHMHAHKPLCVLNDEVSRQCRHFLKQFPNPRLSSEPYE